MKIDAVQFKGHRCFKSDWSGFTHFKPLNVIIGRNNSGKSQLLDLVDAMCEGKLWREGWIVRCSGVLSESVLQRSFPQGGLGGPLGRYDHWNSHGNHLIGAHVSWEIAGERHIKRVEFTDSQQAGAGLEKNQSYEAFCLARADALKGGLLDLRPEIARKGFQRLAAERDIQPEPAAVQLTLSQDGRGATNIIRRYLSTADSRYPRELIQHDLLNALNEIFGHDARFNEIIVRHHDDNPPPSIPKDTWEVFLGEDQKGPVALSRSGSGLKTVILVLLHLLVIPKIKSRASSDFVFAFEELENSLHPALLRRLFQFIERYSLRENVMVFLTTHSSTALDFFGVSPHAQLVHVLHDGKSAATKTVSAHFDKLGVISELGAKPSDLLQANGIIWVEGPSDCIYFNRWIDLLSDGALQEGRDYQCAFYGGSLLARTQFTTPEEAESELVNLFRINPNIVVICDGDRSSQGRRVKDRVRRIRSEVLKIAGAHIWVTGAREIENYLPGGAIAKAFRMEKELPDPSRYEAFFPRKGQLEKSYLERRLNRKTYDKVDLAVQTVPHMDVDTMKSRFEWESEMGKIIARIRDWNK